jgi:hypothetical protein
MYWKILKDIEIYWKILKDIERYWKILKGWELHRAAWRGHAVTRPFNRFAHLVSRFLVAEGMNSSFICRAQSNVSKAETSWISFFEAFLSALGRHTSRSTSCTPTTCKERFKYEHVPNILKDLRLEKMLKRWGMVKVFQILYLRRDCWHGTSSCWTPKEIKVWQNTTRRKASQTSCWSKLITCPHCFLLDVLFGAQNNWHALMYRYWRDVHHTAVPQRLEQVCK